MRRDHKAKQRQAMVTRILDAAEHLFARYGFHGVTLREIAEKVGVSTALIHYHFDGKDSVFDAVWERRAPISASNRMAAMRRYAEEAGDAITVEGALHAWIDTDLIHVANGDDGWKAFAAIASQSNSAVGRGAERMNAHFNPVALALIDLLRRAMPGCKEEALFVGYHFLSGAMTHVMARTGRLDILSDGRCSSEDFDAVRRHLADFMAAGFRSICRTGRNAQNVA